MTEVQELGFAKWMSTLKFAELLREKYPEQRWEKIYLLRGKYGHQKRLEKAVAELFPVHDNPTSPHPQTTHTCHLWHILGR